MAGCNIEQKNDGRWGCTTCGGSWDRYTQIKCAAVSVEGANARQVGGDHYKNGGEEHWDRVARLNLDYFQGQITKYTERWKKKKGIEDLEKARHFLDKYIELATAGLLPDWKP